MHNTFVVLVFTLTYITDYRLIIICSNEAKSDIESRLHSYKRVPLHFEPMNIASYLSSHLIVKDELLIKQEGVISAAVIDKEQ